MNSTRQVNPLARLKLSIVAASLMLAGSWAIIAQSPIADAHAGQTDSAPTTLSESTNTTQSAPWAKESSLHKHQADCAKHTGKTKHERHRGPQSNHRFGNKENKAHGQAPQWGNHQSGNKEDNGACGYDQSHTGKKDNIGQGQAPFWTQFLAEKNGNKDHGQAPQSGKHQSGDKDNTGQGQAPFWTQFLAEKNGDKAHGQAPQWGKHQSGDTDKCGTDSCDQPHTGNADNKGQGQAPFWTQFLAEKNGDKAHGQAPQWGKHQSGDTDKCGTDSCDQPHTGNADNTGSGQAPFWTQFLSGNKGDKTHEQEKQCGKHSSEKKEKSGTHSCKKSCTGKSKHNSAPWSKDVSN